MDIFVAPKKNKKDIIRIEKNHMHALSSFCKNPDGVHFQTQKQGETIILFLRAHFITNISWILITIALIAAPIIILILFPLIDMNFIFPQIAIRFTIVYVIFYYLIVASYAFVSFLHWFFNIFIVTSERVVDIDYYDIVIHNIAITKLSHVQDVNYTQTGFIPTFFNYGDLFVQTAGEEKNFEAPSIPTPREATDIIVDLTEGKNPLKDKG